MTTPEKASEVPSPDALEMLPPEIASHGPVRAFCPHCAVEMEITLTSIWAAVSYWTSRTQFPDQRQRLLEGWAHREECPICKKPVDFSLLPTVTYRLAATAPDPLEKYPPCSRYWEAQKRGVKTGSNLRLTIEKDGDA